MTPTWRLLMAVAWTAVAGLIVAGRAIRPVLTPWDWFVIAVALVVVAAAWLAFFHVAREARRQSGHRPRAGRPG